MTLYFEKEDFGVSYPLKSNFILVIWYFYKNGFKLRDIWK